jgi:DNA polymerase III delta subunit
MKYIEAIKSLQFHRDKKFILIGTESYFKDEFVTTAIQLNTDLNPHKFFPDDGIEPIIEILSTSLFNSELVVLYYFDEFNADQRKKCEELIISYTGMLIIILSDTGTIKSMSKIASICSTVHCNKLSEYGAEGPIWIKLRGSEAGYSFVDGSEDILFKRVGPGLYPIVQELDKLMLYTISTKTISPADIEKVVGTSIVSKYEILDAILQKNVHKSTSLLEDYYKSGGSEEELLFFLILYFEKMYKISTLVLEKGMQPDQMASIVGIPVWLLRNKYIRSAKKWGHRALSRAFERLVKFDSLFKNSALKREHLNSFIFSLVE